MITLKKRVIWISLLFFAYVNTVHANEAHICSYRIPSEMAAATAGDLSDSTKFNCPSLGKLTIPELAKAGWKIAMPLFFGGPNGGIWQTLIQKN